MVAGLLLAAGAGRRYGMPKALVDGGAWLRRAVDVPALVEALKLDLAYLGAMGSRKTHRKPGGSPARGGRGRRAAQETRLADRA